MTDISHNFGQDIALGPTGDLAPASGTVAGQQRVLRRLLTNPGAYIWNLTYGAGLPAFVGQANPGARIRAVSRQQMRYEAIVSQNPPPAVGVMAGQDGSTVLNIGYVDAVTGGNATLTVPVA